MGAKQLFYFNNNELKGEELAPVNAFKPNNVLKCCTFKGGSDVYCLCCSHFCVDSVFSGCFGMHYLVSFLVLQSS